ncbi:uncharacterized protein LOC115402855 [Salarias fasciatus]|uniref:uncharacterized protein LOC115402855 n=1 Tax=Salarias fasciatus TaxID=181472 RepID=UPI0011767C82|nr:uncharacterized protein LOC115402855 [Salarias fasciatus]
MESFVLFRGGRRVSLRGEDMTVDKVCRIFQVSAGSVFITDDTNTAIFPDISGTFPRTNLTNRGHYEVHGDQGSSLTPVNRAPVPFSMPSSSVPSVGSGRAPGLGISRPIGFSRPLQRSIHIGEVVNGRLATSRTVVIRFSEAEATVEGIASKVRDALDSEEDITLTDSQGNEIIDCEGTRNSHYWKQNSRKVFALLDSEFREFQSGRRARTSRRAPDSHLQDVIDKIDELKNAAENLHGISNNINQLSEMAMKKIQEADVQPAVEAFTCLVCKAIMDEPMFSTCCCSLVGCGACVRQWLINADHCLKCRSPDFESNIHQARGLDAALAFFKSVI